MGNPRGRVASKHKYITKSMQIHLWSATILQSLSSSSPFLFQSLIYFTLLFFSFLIPLGRLYINLLPPKSPTWREMKEQGGGGAEGEREWVRLGRRSRGRRQVVHHSLIYEFIGWRFKGGCKWGSIIIFPRYQNFCLFVSRFPSRRRNTRKRRQKQDFAPRWDRAISVSFYQLSPMSLKQLH